jgi:D-arabinitol 4-dehydrogenase
VPTLRERIAAGQPVRSSAVLPALFFAFLTRWHRGELDFVYEDRQLDAAAAHPWFEASDSLGAYCRDPALWGDLAGSGALILAVRAAHERVLALGR